MTTFGFLLLVAGIAICGWIGNALGFGIITNPFFFSALIGASLMQLILTRRRK